MKEFTYKITDAVGIHARPAGVLAKMVKGFASTVTIWNGDKSADLSKLMKVMGLGIKQGTEVKITVDGEDEDSVVAELEKFFKENL